MGIAERREREKAFQREKRRKEIMKAAKKLFRAKGFSSTTMEDIARGAELSPAALYIYFDNKDEIYSSLNISILDKLNKNLKIYCEDNRLNCFEKIEALKEAYYRVFRDDPGMMINVFHLQSSENLARLPEELLAEIKKLTAKSLQITSTIFEEGIKEGVIIDRHPVALADIAWSMFSGLVLWEEGKRSFDPQKDFLKSTLDMAFDIFIDGIRNKEGSCKQ